MELTRVEIGYCTRNGKPKIYVEWQDAENNVIIEENTQQMGDMMLADRVAYDNEVASIQAANDARIAANEIAATQARSDLAALQASGQANLIAGNPLTADEAYVMMHGSLPPT